MNKRKWVSSIIVGFTIASCVACGGGGSGSNGDAGDLTNTGEVNQNGGELDSSLPNKGLKGTLYLSGASGFESLNLANPIIKDMDTSYDVLHTSASSLDGEEHLLVHVPKDSSIYRVDITNNNRESVSSFNIPTYTTGTAKLSPNRQYIAAGIDLSRYYLPTGGKPVSGLRIYDRSGVLLRNMLDDKDNGWYHSA